MRILMMGTGPFAVPTFGALVSGPHDVPLLVTRPTPPVRGRRKPPENPMRTAAESLGVPMEAPESINSEEAHALLQEQQADLFVVCDYGQILSRETLALAPKGGINLHGSLLPRHRGAAPVNWAIYHGDTETGVTVIHMTPQLDAGPCLVQKATPIGPREIAPELEARLAELGVAAVQESLDMLAGAQPGAPLGQPQDRNQATKAPRLTKNDGRVDWAQPARQIDNQVRAFKPWPGTFCFLTGDGQPVRCVLDWVEPSQQGEQHAAPGEVVATSNEGIDVACGAGLVRIERLQPAGKRVMSAAEFLRGHDLPVGAVLT